MAKRFDAALKHLLEHYPTDWIRSLGVPFRGKVKIIDANLSTVTAEADKVFRLQDRTPWLVHLEVQAGRDLHLNQRILRYNVLLRHRHRIPVQSVLVLLRPKADGPEITGVVKDYLPTGVCYLEFHYTVIRLWQLPVETVLAGGLGTLPLAPLTQVEEEALPAVLHRMGERLNREAEPGEAESLWTATYVLLGLRFPTGNAAHLLREVRSMEESVTYQAIEAEGMKKLLRDIGYERFGPPDQETDAAIEAIIKPRKIRELGKRLLKVSSWEELLAPVRNKPGSGKRKKAT